MKCLRAFYCVTIMISLLLPAAPTGLAHAYSAPYSAGLIRPSLSTVPASAGQNPTPNPYPAPPPPAAPIAQLAPAAVLAGPSVSPTFRQATLNPGDTDSFQITVNTGDAPIDKADIMFAFDLTGSMGDEIAQAKASAQAMAQAIRAQLPNSWFGVGSFMDYPGTFAYPGYSAAYGDAASGDVPWRLNLSPTSALPDFIGAVNSLTLGYGVDDPEDYTRALYELGQLGQIGWRKGAKKIVVLFGDAPTHDLNFGGSNFGGDPGLDSIAQTPDDLDFETVVQDLAAKQISVLAIDSGSTPASAATFKGMSIGFAGLGGTGGQYFVLSNTADLPNAVVQLVHNETLTIDDLSLKVTPGYETWVTLTPPTKINVPAQTAETFNVSVTPPAGTVAGYYPIAIQTVADGVILGITTVYVLVPAPAPGNDLGFQPYPNGFGSATFSAAADWAMFRQFFGSKQVEYNGGNRIFAADKFFQNQYSLSGGTSYGFGGLSLANFKSFAQPNAGSYALSKHVNLAADSDTPLEFTPMKNAITYAARTSYSLESAANASFFCGAFGVSPSLQFQYIKSLIANGSPAVVTISYVVDTAKPPNLPGNLAAVSVAPYRFDQPNADTANVFVYDSNAPGDTGYRLRFDLKNGTLRYDDTSPDPGSTGIIATWAQIQAAPCQLLVTPLDLFLRKGVPQWEVPIIGTSAANGGIAAAAASDAPAVNQPQVFVVRGSASLLVEDDSGRRFGFNDGVFHNDIPGAVYLVQPGAGPDDPGEYILPGGFQYRLWLVGTQTGRATLMTWLGSTFVELADVAVTEGSMIAINLAGDGATVSVSGDTSPTTATISINHLLGDEDRTATAGDLQVQEGQTVQMSYVVDQPPAGGIAAAAVGTDRFSVSSTGGPAAPYNLSLQRSGISGYSVFGAPGIMLDANSSQALSITDWTELSQVAIAVDEGRDGTVDNYITAPNASTAASVTVTAAPASVAVGGSETEITVAVRDQFGAYAPDGTAVTLAATGGVLSAASGATLGGLVTIKLTSGTEAGTVTVSAVAGDAAGETTVIFLPAAGDIRGTVFADLNRNGIRDGGEPGLAGVTILATGRGNGAGGAAVTGADGAYRIENVPITGYTVSAGPRAGLHFTTASSFDVDVVGAGADAPAIGGLYLQYLPRVANRR